MLATLFAPLLGIRMTDIDLDRIERQLDVTLPAEYRRMMLNFPIPVSTGQTDSALWDSVDSLIRMNQEYRRGFGGAQPWPKNYLFIGDDGTACPYLVDLTQNPSPVLHLEHGNPKIVLGHWRDVDEWMKQYLSEIGDLAFQQPKRLGLREVIVRSAIVIFLAAILGTAIAHFLLL
jgi:hypothetical protein